MSFLFQVQSISTKKKLRKHPTLTHLAHDLEWPSEYAARPLAPTMSKTSDQRSTIVMPSVDEDKVIRAAAKADPDAQPLTPGQLAAMVPAAKVLRGRPKSDKKNR
jgi:predicted DNA-binding transcriptional regulator YafY